MLSGVTPHIYTAVFYVEHTIHKSHSQDPAWNLRSASAEIFRESVLNSCKCRQNLITGFSRKFTRLPENVLLVINVSRNQVYMEVEDSLACRRLSSDSFTHPPLF